MFVVGVSRYFVVLIVDDSVDVASGGLVDGDDKSFHEHLQTKDKNLFG